MKGKISTVIIIILFDLLVMLILSYPLMRLWNEVISKLFNFNETDFVGMFVLQCFVYAIAANKN
jgi:hypothetical protein